MELVYLWVEEYKNIRNQGFNFSPRFECEFDEDTKELTITENKDYVSIFPKNINITAIVGGNGSGKSSILTLIHDFFLERIPLKIFFIFYHEKELYLYSGENISITENKSNLKKIKFLTNIREHNFFRNIHEVYYKNENNKQFSSNKNNKEFNLNSDNSSHIIKHFLKALVLLNKKQFSNIMFNPEYIEIYIEHKNLSEDLDEYESSIKKQIKNKITYIKNKKCKKKEILKQIFEILELKSNENNIAKEINQNDIDQNDIDQNDIDDITNLISRRKSFYSQFILIEKYKLKDELIRDLNCVQLPFSEDLNDNYFFRLKIDEIENSTLEFIYNLPSIAFNINILDEHNVSFNSLSFGEKNLLTMLSMFISLSQEKTYEEYGTEIIDVGDLEVDEVERDIIYDEKINQNFFLIDEYELGLHPQWHKEVLNSMILFFSKLNKNIHLILTTHSPFILSDLPKDNVIFLDKYDDKKTKEKYPKLDIKGLENGNCINVSKYIKIKPFGANIHTLLSNGFFMSDGLMGEFAKSKIEEIKKFYEIVKFLEPKNKKYKRILKIFYLFKIKKFNHIQSIIGEPFLQTIIKNYLDDLYLIFSDDKTLIDKELIELEKKKAYLESLKNGKN